ncbi:glycosyltransferase family 2 protein [Luteibacter sp. UNCMF366Tsu5.1]|uniref:glycosyltransferase family 2 protein n=1 Tax=Luteibacter sp. UNCMF366Tsu5.1 TaxID=1502758 RepID=UPI000908C0AC|nr:glycosyltransferase family 2 protein [Luteibacter sp. UNCMF366Tsu5.1]SFW61497.1 Glycosyl transferase family 2 [Luteibacter sp. UNCMF366Tsu5.1]
MSDQSPASRPTLSIIVATYNAARTIERCLASIVRQSSSDWELIVVDGMSSDDTMAVVERFADYIAYGISEPDSGIYDAWNKALAQAKGKYVCFLGADDAFSDDDAVSALMEATAGRSFDLVSSRCRWVDAEGAVIGEGGGAWDFAKIGRRMPMCHPGLWHARDLFDHYGHFEASYRITGDLDFLLRLPSSTRALHVERITVNVENAGISRAQVLRRLREQRRALAACPRFGTVRAWAVWADKMWRYPIARALDIPF